LIVFYGDQITNRQLWHLTIHSRGHVSQRIHRPWNDD
jgi:hypothetical protein